MLFKKGIYGSGLVGKLSIKVISRIEQVVMRSFWHNIYANCRPTFEGDRGTIILVLKLAMKPSSLIWDTVFCRHFVSHDYSYKTYFIAHC
jgi:hypothetical protein